MEGHGGGPASPLEDCSLCPAMLPAPSSAPRFTTQQLVGASEICPIVSFLCSKPFHDLPNSAESKPKSCYSLQCPAWPPGPGPPGFIPRCSPLSLCSSHGLLCGSSIYTKNTPALPQDLHTGHASASLPTRLTPFLPPDLGLVSPIPDCSV